MDQDLMDLLQAQQEEQVLNLKNKDQKETLAELYKKQQEDALMQRDLLKKQLEAHLAAQATPIDWTPLAAALKDWTGSDAPLVAAQSQAAQTKADQSRGQELMDKLVGQKQPGGEWIAKAMLSQPAQELKQQLGEERLKKAKEGTEAQKAAAGFARRLEQSEQVFKNLSEAGFNRASADMAAASKLPNAAKPGDLLAQEQAERNFINAVLRRESGAAIAPSEFASAEQQYFPRLGDTEDVIAQKNANRQQVLESLKAGAGSALDAVPLISVPKKAMKAKPQPKKTPAMAPAEAAPAMSVDDADALLKSLGF